ncbi:hypothetical protein [Roseateles terrae]|uniref:L,D-transpeptidase n=1 Tax=Roseateles terrae TaxID=431060 RepID=A0ABR6GV32_9BURK|nr:hypothetical protein [Roseateles terrae]MBB3195537.1 hypothetical protein [Roseateles terrae]
MLRASSGYSSGDSTADDSGTPAPPAAGSLRDNVVWAAQGLALGLVAAAIAWPAARYVMREARAVQQPDVVQTQGPQRAAGAIPPRPRMVLGGKADFGKVKASSQARQLAGWVMAGYDHGGRPFAILDKRQAQVFVFYPDGKLAGATPVLLGYAAGDDSVAGIGLRPIAEVKPSERTTAAGRFVAQPGRNAMNEDVLWVDYEAAVSMHRVRPTNPAERRLERLATPTPKDNRISYGCINMPVKFFESQLWPIMGKRGGIVYVLPEKKSMEQVFSEQMKRAQAGMPT